MPNAFTFSAAITAGPDGAMWFVDGAIGRISTSGVVTQYGTTNLLGTGIVSGADGALWFTVGGENGPGNVGRITTSGSITEYPSLPNGAVPGGIAAGPDGALWFTDIDNREVDRITTSGVMMEYPIGENPFAITAGSDGALWFTDGGVGRITTSGAVTNFPSGDVQGPFSIVSGPDGALWYTVESLNQIGRITTSGMSTVYAVPQPIPTPNDSIASGLNGLTVGPDGALWFTESNINRIGRMTTSGVVTEYLLPTPASSNRPYLPGGIAAGPDGGIWFFESGANIGEIVIAPNAPPPLLSVTSTHTGNFSQGQSNQTYTITVSNQTGAQSTIGTVTVTDTLPSGLTLVSMTGSGWTCSANTCSRIDSLLGGNAYPAITVTVNVPTNAPSPQVNQVSVQGGGSVAASASDSTTIIQLAPLLSVTKTHTGNFSAGQTNATYTVTVSNTGTAPTNGAVTVTDTLPSGLTLVSMAGVAPCTATNCSGWTCTVNSCMRSDSLAGGASYPAIIVTVNVAADATSPQVNTVSVSGGGTPPASAADSTIISGPPHPPFFTGEASVGSGVYYLVFPDGNLFGYYTYLTGPFIYHYDMGFEYVLPSNDANGDVYFYDFESEHWWFTGPTLFPYIYDFNLNLWVFYEIDPSNPGHYTANPRSFASTVTHMVFTM